MKINILKLEKTQQVNGADNINIIFDMTTYPKYILLESTVSTGVAEVIETGDMVTLQINEIPAGTTGVKGVIYFSYNTELTEQEYLEFTHNNCVTQIKRDDFIIPLTLPIDRVSPCGELLIYNITFNDLDLPRELEAILLPEDSYILSPAQSLTIKYNPEVTNLKRNIVDVVTPTLGSAYPFIRRAGAQRYKTFTLGGLISIEAENPDAPWGVDSTDNGEKRDAQTVTYTLLTEADRTSLQAIDNMQLDSYDARAAKERIYRERVLDFLEDGKIKLFKSVQEGNIFVYLSNVSLTADKPSGRNLYSFSCTATEVTPQYENYGLIREGQQ